MLHSYNLAGTADSFSDVISDISPEDTLIVSTSKKAPTPSTQFKWQIDSLDSVIYDLATSHEVLEGADADPADLIATEEKSGNTQIFTKTISVSDSALATSTHGRKGELKLQLIKAGREIKIKAEKAFSSKQVKRVASNTEAARSDGLYAQIAKANIDNPKMSTPTNTGDYAVHKTGAITFDSIDSICLALYRNGSKANVILANPALASKINEAIDGAAAKKVEQMAMQDEFTLSADVKRQVEVKSFTDSFGYVWEIKYSRFMPTDIVYFLNTEDLTQRVLREPKATQLGKQGSFETWQLVLETGLALSNPYAAGVLDIT